MLILCRSDGSLLVISDRKLFDEEFSLVLDSWTNRRHECTHLKMSCAVDSREGYYRKAQGPSLFNTNCVCAVYSQNKTSKWRVEHASKCSPIPRLKRSDFTGFDIVRVFDIANFHVADIAVDVFRDLTSIERIRFSYGVFSNGSINAGLLCGLHCLVAMDRQFSFRGQKITRSL